MYDHILNTACRYGRHTSKKTLNVWKLFSEGQQSWSKDWSGNHMRNVWSHWDCTHYSREDFGVTLTWSKRLKFWLRKERVDSQSFFQLATDSHNLRGHSRKLFLPRCSTTVRKMFFSTRVVSHSNALPQHVIEAPSVNSFKNRLDKHWSDMGI